MLFLVTLVKVIKQVMISNKLQGVFFLYIKVSECQCFMNCNLYYFQRNIQKFIRLYDNICLIISVINFEAFRNTYLSFVVLARFGIKHSYTGLFRFRTPFSYFEFLLFLHQQKTDSYAAQSRETINGSYFKTVGTD
jgi:hypothetical protein